MIQAIQADQSLQLTQWIEEMLKISGIKNGSPISRDEAER
jgi:hypothetical protein